MPASQRTPKRVRVEGIPNLYRRPADGRYEVGYTGSDGKWHIKTIQATTLTGAKKELHELLGKRDRNEDVAPRSLTLNDVADKLFAEFESKVSRGERSARTLEIYRQRWDTHIRPTFGRRRVQAVGVAHVSQFLAELRHKTNPASQGRKPPRAALELDGAGRHQRAERCGGARHQAGVRGEQPGAETERKPPARNRSKARILEAEEVALLIEHAPEGYRSLIFTAAYTGMRQSELLGLRWGDVDFDAETIHVRHQLTRATTKQAARVVPLKTDAAERHIDIAPALARELAKHSLGSRHSKPQDFVFATETGKPLYYRNVSARGLDKAADRAGLSPEGMQRLSFHDLRHTAITHLIRSGADTAQVSRFAGHSKVSTTLDLYVGEFEKRKVNDSGQRLAEVYAGAV